MNQDKDKTFLKVGILAGVLASLCCIGPLILIALGLGTASSVLSIGYGKPYFLAGALLFFVVAVVFYLRKRNKVAVCDDCGDGTPSGRKNSLIIQIVLAFCAMVLLYLFLTFVFVPYLAPLVYKYLY